jgi:S1/P1 Nuclease
MPLSIALKRITPLLGFLALGCARTAFAWNSFGHMMIAAVAYEHLTPAAQTRVSQLLQLNPDYPKWVAHTPKEERDELAFVVAATWADNIKSEPGYQDDGERPTSPDAARNSGYADHLQHRYWHFIDLPFSQDHTALQPAATPNAQTQIGVFRKTLASRDASDALKSYDLVWLLHLVGDVHQPLHTTSRFTHSQPNGDEGGNRVALCEKPCRKELHAYWDELPGTGKKAIVAIRRAAHLPTPLERVAAIDDERQWIHESFLIAQNSVYIPPIGDGPGPFFIDRPYQSIAHRVARDRLALAGARLAHVLNETFH